jgi:hypothetical protein
MSKSRRSGRSQGGSRKEVVKRERLREWPRLVVNNTELMAKPIKGLGPHQLAGDLLKRARSGDFNDWETDFLITISVSRWSLSPKQYASLATLADKVEFLERRREGRFHGL